MEVSEKMRIENSDVTAAGRSDPAAAQGDSSTARSNPEAIQGDLTEAPAASYLQLCMEQVRSKKMRPVLEQELRAHIEDQKEAYLASGMEEKEAEALAVRQMGDPVETGTAFDRVHRPRMDWYAIGMVLAAALVGTALYTILYLEKIVGAGLFYNFLAGTAAGLPVMAALCFLDYTVLAKYPRMIWYGGLACTLAVTLLTDPINGRAHVGWITMLLMPLYAGIVYTYRGQRYRGIVKALSTFAFSWILLMLFGALDTSSMRVLFEGGCLGMLLLAVAKGWYQVPRRTALWLGAVLLAGVAAVGGYAYRYGGFRRQRILAWLHPEEYAEGAGYLAVQMRTVRNQLQWTGSGAAGSAWMQEVLAQQENYLFLGMLQCFGILVSTVVVLLLIRVCWVLLRKIWSVKNRLGFLTGFACFLTILIPLFLHVAVNLGLLPVTDCWMPFFSGGGKSCVAFYAVLGLMLSVFRTKDCARELAGQQQADAARIRRNGKRVSSL